MYILQWLFFYGPNVQDSLKLWTLHFIGGQESLLSENCISERACPKFVTLAHVLRTGYNTAVTSRQGMILVGHFYSGHLAAVMHCFHTLLPDRVQHDISHKLSPPKLTSISISTALTSWARLAHEEIHQTKECSYKRSFKYFSVACLDCLWRRAVSLA